ncbi:Reverse transcriptase-like [Sesbania bispinosa]|nr:Reverse transcriptase-like [Sesbania bispinosa]
MDTIMDCLNMFVEPQAKKLWLTKDLGRYLVCSLVAFSSYKSTYEYLVDQAHKRLASWKADSLSFVGRITLAKSVLQALPSYTMQTVLLPKGVCAKLEKICRSFCGELLGFHFQVGWKLIDSPDELWVRVLRGKYRAGSAIIPLVKCPISASLTWRGICRTWKEALETDPPAALMHATVRDLSDGTGSWSLSDAAHLIPQGALLEINATLAGVDNSLSDKPIWRWSHDGVFSTKSAYEAIANLHSVSPNTKWKTLWHCLGGISNTYLRSCACVTPIWHYFHVHGAPSLPAHDADMEDWIFSNINTGCLQVLGLDWNILFGVACSQIWRSRNECVFQNAQWDSDSKAVVDIIQGHCPDGHPCFSMISLIKHLSNNLSGFHISHTVREGNRVADSLAAYGHSLSLGTSCV